MTPCPVCTGDLSAPPCGEECDRVIKSQRIRGLQKAARRAVNLARRYSAENMGLAIDASLLAPAVLHPGKLTRALNENDSRIKGCVEQVQAYRASIRSLRQGAA